MSQKETRKRPGKKSVNETTAREGDGAANTARMPPDWKAHLSFYEDQRILKFATQEDLEAAIDLLWTPELRTLPHDTPDGKLLVIPAEAVVYFTRAGLQFVEQRVRFISELSPDEVAKLRRWQHPTQG
jgi:hypothetical protein